MPRASSEVTRVRTVRLTTPPALRIVPAHVFDAFGWCRSDELEWRRPASRWDATTPIDGADAARMVFVLRGPCAFLPSEPAHLHAFGLGLEGDAALAPWAIDVATDELFTHGIRPTELLWLAADNLNALFWGLHDWTHFHHHGPFDERAWTELQCDATALAWLWVNRALIPLADAAWETLRVQVASLSAARFEAEGKPCDARLLAPPTLLSAIEAPGRTAG